MLDQNSGDMKAAFIIQRTKGREEQKYKKHKKRFMKHKNIADCTYQKYRTYCSGLVVRAYSEAVTKPFE